MSTAGKPSSPMARAAAAIFGCHGPWMYSSLPPLAPNQSMRPPMTARAVVPIGPMWRLLTSRTVLMGSPPAARSSHPARQSIFLGSQTRGLGIADASGSALAHGEDEVSSHQQLTHLVNHSRFIPTACLCLSPRELQLRIDE